MMRDLDLASLSVGGGPLGFFVQPVGMDVELAAETIRVALKVGEPSEVFETHCIVAWQILRRDDPPNFDEFISRIDPDRRATLYRRLDRNRVNDSASGFNFLTVAELLGQCAPTWRVLRVIPTRGLVVIWGAPGSGKTFVALELACAVVRGIPWGGRRTKRGTVAYIAAEGQLRERVAAYNQSNKLVDTDLAGLRVLDSAVNMLDPGADLEPLLHALRTLALLTGGVAMVIIDTLNRVMPGGDENSSGHMGAVIAAAKQIERELCCVVVFVHHSGKDEAKGGRGHSSLKAATDAELSIKRHGEIRTVTAEKIRDGVDGETLLTFCLEVVDLGPMADIDPEAEPSERRTSCVVVVSDAPPPLVGIRLSDTDHIALREFKALCAESAERTPHTSIHPAGRPVARVADWRERFRRARGVDKADPKAMEASKRAFQRSADKLVKQGAIGIHESRVWLW